MLLKYIKNKYKLLPIKYFSTPLIGLAQFREPKKNNLLHMLLMPFTDKTGSYSIDGHGADPERIVRR
jgi:hypothetical protein